MNKAYLLIGGNVGNRRQHLEAARSTISMNCGTIMQSSSLYETAAWGKTDQQAFLNQALLVETAFTPETLLAAALRAESSLGRIREEKYGPRVIDIDIIFFNSEVVDSPALTIPHPQVQFRRFALVPLVEIAPDYEHPLFHKTLTKLLEECPDTLEVNKLPS